MSDLVNIKEQMLRNARNILPPMLGMSVILGLFNASEWTLSAILPKVTLSVSIALLGCLFGLIALFVGLLTTNKMQSILSGWLAGLVVGLSGIAFMLWFYATPVN
jgi:hypothetical protein